MKLALFAFNGETMCFVHVLLNGLDMLDRGLEPAIVVEGSATAILPEIATPAHRMNGLYARARERNLFEGACRACSNQMGVQERVQELGLPLLDDMQGHPSMGAYVRNGWSVLTF
jgi:hypothetical protein